MSQEYIATVGLEIHVQLKTRSKMFCACPVEYGATPNTHTCPVCLGLPGALPVMNEEALRLTALAGLMLGCDIADVCKFDRKSYYYPDVAKNYQISQYDMPLCLGGGIPLHDLAYPKDAQKSIAAKDKVVRLTRIHLEEDVAKSFHLESASGIDFNRSGTPLMEIVTEADIGSPEEAFACLTSLKQHLLYAGVSDADMEKGQMRCDVNVSVRPVGTEKFGTKIELKNLNTISGARRALAYEIERQIGIVRSGGVLQQETRRWDDDLGETQLMRVKESAHDYRYFPDPDLMPVKTDGLLAAARAVLPETPAQKRARYEKDFGVSAYDAAVLADNLDLGGYFERAAAGSPHGKQIANWILNDLQSALSSAGQPLAGCLIQPAQLAALTAVVAGGQINSKQAREVFADMFATGSEPSVIIEEKGLKQESDAGAIGALCDQVIAANPQSVADYKAGKAVALNFLKGQVMKLSKGKANPAMAGELLAQKLG